MLKLNEETIRGLQPPPKGNRIDYFAGHTLQGLTAPRGFGVRITATGARAFILNYRTKGAPATDGKPREGSKERRYTIGAWPDWTAIRAIKEARRIRELIDKGADPVSDRREAMAPPLPEPKVETVADMLDAFITDYVEPRLRSAKPVRSALDRLVKPKIGQVPLMTLRRSAVAKMLDDIAAEAGPVAADRALAYLRKAFAWKATKTEDFASPLVRGMGKSVAEDRARERILSAEEIRDLWAALARMEAEPGNYTGSPKERPVSPFPAIVRLLLVTGQRRDEVARMEWSEIDGSVWTIPAGRYKTKRAHSVPLSDLAADIIGPRRPGRFVFSTTNGAAAFSGHGKAKATLDDIITKIRAEDGRPPMPAWWLHDLRRTARSLMSQAKVPTDIAERVIGHAIQGVRRVYDRHDYLDEKRGALASLAKIVGDITAPRTGNVVELRPMSA